LTRRNFGHIQTQITDTLRNTVLRVCLLRYWKGSNYWNTSRNENFWKRNCKPRYETHVFKSSL